MKSDTAYLYGKHAIEEAQAHMPHVIGKVMTNVKGEGHGGYVATVDTSKLLVPYSEFKDGLKPSADTALVVLAGLTDPHNVGTIIRSAAAFGASAVLLPTRGQAPITTAVIKTSVGMVFRIPLISIDSVPETLADLRARGVTTYGLAGKGSANLHTEPFATPSAFVVGNEGAGMDAETEALCDQLLSIPINSRTESLNAAAAAAVTLYAWSARHPQSLI
ncbi:MAG: RNA methyltransferase [Patescibacteria group bacterium]